jgi:hypothetical protein
MTRTTAAFVLTAASREGRKKRAHGPHAEPGSARVDGGLWFRITRRVVGQASGRAKLGFRIGLEEAARLAAKDSDVKRIVPRNFQASPPRFLRNSSKPFRKKRAVPAIRDPTRLHTASALRAGDLGFGHRSGLRRAVSNGVSLGHLAGLPVLPDLAYSKEIPVEDLVLQEQSGTKESPPGWTSPPGGDGVRRCSTNRIRRGPWP